MTSVRIAPQISANHALRRIGMIMANGKKMASSHFLAHTGHMITLDNLYQDEQRAFYARVLGSVATITPSVIEGQDSRLVAFVQTYLDEARGHVPHAATPEEAPQLIEQMRTLMDEYGLLPIALFLRQMAAAPLDSF